MGSNLEFGISFKDTLIGAVMIKALTFIMVSSRATVVLTVVLRVSYAPALTRYRKTAVAPEGPCVPGTALWPPTGVIHQPISYVGVPHMQ